MKYSSKNLPNGNPLANLLVIVVGTLVIAASIVLGFFAFPCGGWRCRDCRIRHTYSPLVDWAFAEA